MPKPRKRVTTKTGAPQGIVCKNCGCQHFHVVYLVHQTDGRIRRVRECRHCQRRVITYEKAT